MASILIQATRSVVGQQPDHRRLAEDAAQTFLDGAPVMVKQSTGGVVEWDGTTVASGIAGVSKSDASNLTTIGTPQTLTYGKVVNQPFAVKIPMGAPLNDGRIGVDTSDASTVFRAQVGPAQSTAVTDLTKQYGLTKDSDGHWYVDKTKTGASAVVVVQGFDNWDKTRGVRISFIPAAQQQLL